MILVYIDIFFKQITLTAKTFFKKDFRINPGHNKASFSIQKLENREYNRLTKGVTRRLAS